MTGGGPEQLATGVHILIILTLITLAPALLVLTTSFTRIVVVLALMRQALGTPSIPPNMVLIPLALFLTLLSMGPTLDRVYEEALIPSLNGELAPLDAYAKAAAPLRDFMRRQTRRAELETLMESARLPMPEKLEDIPDRVLVPAFALSELKAAFTMGFLIFLSFMAVDLVVAGVLMALGMFMVPPSTISLPLKLLLFVMADGWNLIAHGLLTSFR
ncbi:MAG: flagellar type III secretion system pore protein FliP [Vulcanimicrobiota bacterium]